jgi:hypothetical protein
MYDRLGNLKQPSDDDMVWRYMDLARFVSLLSTRALYLTSSDSMADKWEGVYGPVNRRNREMSVLPWSPGFDKIEADRRTQMFLSCWHVSPRESAAMWEIYQRDGRGVAVQSTWGQLTQSIANAEEHVVGALVEYMDYDKSAVPEDNLFLPFARKRLSYEHEREARLIYWSAAAANKHLGPRGNANGTLIESDLDVLVTRVFVAPDSPDWIVDVVESLITAYGHSFEIVRSNLYDGPLL